MWEDNPVCHISERRQMESCWLRGSPMPGSYPSFADLWVRLGCLIPTTMTSSFLFCKIGSKYHQLRGFS